MKLYIPTFFHLFIPVGMCISFFIYTYGGIPIIYTIYPMGYIFQGEIYGDNNILRLPLTILCEHKNSD